MPSAFLRYTVKSPVREVLFSVLGPVISRYCEVRTVTVAVWVLVYVPAPLILAEIVVVPLTALVLEVKFALVDSVELPVSADVPESVPRLPLLLLQVTVEALVIKSPPY